MKLKLDPQNAKPLYEQFKIKEQLDRIEKNQIALTSQIKILQKALNTILPKPIKNTNVEIPKNEVILNTIETAAFLNLSESTIRHWATKNKLPSFYKNGVLKFSKSQLENWILNQH